MKIFSQTYEREGNDSWLIDRVELHRDDFGFYLDHRVKHTGWQGDIKEHHTLDLDIDDIESSQQKINEYLYNNSLEKTEYYKDGIEINLAEILNER